MEQVTRQFGTHNPWFRVVRSIIAGLGAILAIGHLPGWDSEAQVWAPMADTLFQYIGVVLAMLSGLITSERKPVK